MTKILIIDDNVNLTTLLSKALAKFGFEPYAENNSLLAFGTVRQVVPDLILLDVMMPERDGGRVLADLRADLATRYIPVILLTALAREAQTLGDMDGIKSKVIGKPVDLKQLLSEIEIELDRVRTYNQQLAAQQQQSRQQLHQQHALPPGVPPQLPFQPQQQASSTPALQRQAGPPPPPIGSSGRSPFFGSAPAQEKQATNPFYASSDSDEPEDEPISASNRWGSPS